MRKKILAVSCLALGLATGLNAGRNRALQAPVCRFIDFYTAAERSEMTGWERVIYSLAVATKSPARGCSGSSANSLAHL